MSVPAVLNKRCAAIQLLGERVVQEDVFAMVDLGSGDTDRLLLVVSDGMGGHAGGRAAAHGAVAAFVDSFCANTGPLPARLRPALDAAGVSLFSWKASHPEYAEAGCTLVAAAVDACSVWHISVGDSLLLVRRGAEVTRVNDDHSMRPVFAELVVAGRMSEAAAQTGRNRNALRSAVTGDPPELVDAPDRPVLLQPGDDLILASDGLDSLAYSAVAELLRSHQSGTAAEAAAVMVERVQAASNPSQDNATVVVYRATTT